MKFKYTGPFSGVTLVIDGTEQEVMLHPGKEVDLPENHEYTKTLVALKHLHKVPTSKAKEASTKGDK